MSPRKSEPEVTGFARAVADALETLIEARGISKRELARMVERSNNYIAMRFRHEAAFTLSDIDVICRKLGIEPGSFVAGDHSRTVTADELAAKRAEMEAAAEPELRAVAQTDDGLPDAQDGDEMPDYDAGDAAPDSDEPA